MNDVTLQALLSVLRSLLIVGGSWLTTKGYLSDGNVEQIIGAICVLVPLVWGAWQKYQAERKAKNRIVNAEVAAVVEAKSMAAVKIRAGAAKS